MAEALSIRGPSLIYESAKRATKEYKGTEKESDALKQMHREYKNRARRFWEALCSEMLNLVSPDIRPKSDEERETFCYKVLFVLSRNVSGFGLRWPKKKRPKTFLDVYVDLVLKRVSIQAARSEKARNEAIKNDTHLRALDQLLKDPSKILA